MGRGAQAETRSQVDQQLAAQNAYNQQMAAQQQTQRNQIAAGYQNQIANAGYTPEQQSAISNQSLGSLGSAFAALAQSAANRSARTRNSAGYGDMLDELAREQTRQAGSLAQQNQLAFADRARNDQLNALQGLAGLYGVDASTLARAMGIPVDLLNVRESASRGGFLDAFGAALGGSVGQIPGRYIMSRF